MSRARALVWALAICLALTPLCAHAADALSESIGGICAYARGENTLQEWLDGPLSAGAGGATDGYALCLARLGAELNASAYARAAEGALLESASANPVTRQRTALALIAFGAADAVPENLVDDTAGQLGLMSDIFALHLLNNGAPSKDWTADALGESLIVRQFADGGWAVMGNYGDVDVTAMCLQALAVWKGGGEARAEAVERALAFLSERQLESGGFASMGKENAESSAQIVVALCALGVDPEADARFAKGESDPVSALMAYRLPSGGFSHFPGDVENATATLQALQALCALADPSLPLYDLSRPASGVRLEDKEAARGWKFWAYLIIAALAFAGVLAAMIRRRGAIKRALFSLALALVAAFAVSAINVESASDYYSVDSARPASQAGEAYLSIRCDRVAGRAKDGSTPEDGVILARTAVPFAEGDSVFDLLTAAARAYNIQMEHEGGGDMAYINGINYLYEYDYGELSGWIYSVNGETPSVGCGSYALHDGDEVLWQYTTELGEDLK